MFKTLKCVYLTSGFSGLGLTIASGSLSITPSPTESVTAAVSGSHQGRVRVRVQTPSTPELYSALNLSYNCRSVKTVWDW